MKVLIFLPNYIGDILQTTPAVRFLKKNFPESEIGVVTLENKKQLLEDNPDIGKIIFRSGFGKTLKAVRRFGADGIILFRTTFFNSLISGIVRPDFSIGFSGDLSFLFLKRIFYPGQKHSYREECYLLVKRFLESISLKIEKEPDLKKIIFAGWDRPEVIESLQKKMEQKGNFSAKNIIVLNPFSSRKTKMLFPEQYTELGKWLIEQFGKEYELVVVGGKDERAIVEPMFNKIPIRNFAGELNLKELGYLLSGAKIFITPDSGPAYIAQAVNCPTVIFFTSTLPERFGPYPGNVRTVYQAQICSPCYKDKCHKNYRCVREFPLEALKKKIIELLAIKSSDRTYVRF